MTNNSLESRIQQARDLFTSGYNCAQAVFLTYADLFSIDKNLAATIAAPFGGGMGRLREVCGTVSGMSFIAGLLEPAADPADRPAKSRNYALVQECANEFRELNGSIVCRELLGLTRQQDPPTPAERTPEYYRKRPCVELVGIAARIIGRKLVERGLLNP